MILKIMSLVLAAAGVFAADGLAKTDPNTVTFVGISGSPSGFLSI
jgi:hypothetical protein